MADCKIIFLDVDGTITDYENNVPPSAVRAIRLARARGHRVYMCTGRSKAENPPEIWAIGFDGMIGGNGSYVEDAGEVVMHQLITLDQCKRIVDWLQALVLPREQQRSVCERTLPGGGAARTAPV